MLLLEAPTVPIDMLIDAMCSYVTKAFCSSLLKRFGDDDLRGYSAYGDYCLGDYGTVHCRRYLGAVRQITSGGY